MRKMYFLFTLVFIAFGCGGGGTNRAEDHTITAKIPTSGLELAAKDIKVVYPADTFNAPATVTQTEMVRSSSMPTNHDAKQIGAALSIDTDQQISKAVTVYFPDPGGDIEDIVPAISSGTNWVYAEPKRVDGKIAVNLQPTTLDDASNQPFLGKIFVVLSKIFGKEIEPKLVHMAGSTGFSRAGIIIHGWIDQVDSFQSLADKLIAEGVYDSVYGYQYDWTKSTDKSSQHLVEKLDQIYEQNRMKTVDIIAHSRGGLIARDSLEIQGATGAVLNCFIVCTPHEGTRFGQNIHSLVSLLRGNLLNNPIGWGVARLDTVALKEMFPDSGFLANLNSFSGQTGVSNYFLYSGEQDIFVDNDSARATNTTIRELTGGHVIREILPGGHSYLVKDPDGIDILVSKIKYEVNRSPVNNAGIGNSGSPDIDPDPNGITWSYNSYIFNDSGVPIIARDIMLELYDAYGEWVGTWWVDLNNPDGAFFPTSYTPMNHQLASGSRLNMPIKVYAGVNRPTIASAPENRRRQTAVMTLRYIRNGEQYTIRNTVYCYYQGRRPELAHTRSPRSSDGEIGAFSFAKR